MSHHIPDVTKMISDTPRMKAAQMAAMEHMTGDVYRVGCQLERELNAANEMFRKLNIHALNLTDRIKRLEDAGDALSKILTYDIIQNMNWRKAEEAKP